MINNKRFRFRIIVPAFPNFNVYSFAASKTTSYGPIIIASCANNLEKWDVEVIDENNLHGKFYPRDDNGKLDHITLQEERPADVIGFYCSISSTIPHVYELAKLYKDMGGRTIGGGKHVENMREEALSNNIDIVAVHEAEYTIRELLTTFQDEKELDDVNGIIFLKNGKLFRTPDRELIMDFDVFPFPDYNLMRYAKIKFFPINRTRGCNSRCEFCAVKDKARFCSPDILFEQIKYLVETQNAYFFFETSDHFAADRDDAIRFCKLFCD